MNARINEFFVSIQGEGTCVGVPTLFIRFAGCNLDCDYCDTSTAAYQEYTPEAFFKRINAFDRNSYTMISLTGGEPLLQADFLKEVLPRLKRMHKTIYLETNGSLPAALESIVNYIDCIAADIKMHSMDRKRFPGDCARFLTAGKKKLFVKMVITPGITLLHIKKAIAVLKRAGYAGEIILQPQTQQLARAFKRSSGFVSEFIRENLDVRIVPQIHTFLNIE